VSPGYSAPWAGPGVPLKAIKWMLMTHSPLVIWPLLDVAMWRWGCSMLMNCTESAYRLNKSRMWSSQDLVDSDGEHALPERRPPCPPSETLAESGTPTGSLRRIRSDTASR
jgi:hypothetical protein